MLWLLLLLPSLLPSCGPRRSHLPCGRERCVPPSLGVGGYCNWIESNFPRSHTSAVQGEGVDVLAIDMNGLIHSQLRHVRSQEAS